MPKIDRLASYFIFSLNALLIFLWLYRDQLSAPVWLQTFGRMHPMILHLPIGFFVMVVVIIFLKGQFKPKVYKRILKLVFIITALVLVITALAGIILSLESGYDSDTLKSHLNSGVLLSLITAVISAAVFRKKLSVLQFSLTGAGFIILVITGHYGATLTHGEGYLLGPTNFGNSRKDISEDSITIFSKAILPVFDKKCASCHNPKKRKGDLILTDQAGIMKGGENGLVINPKSLHESELLRRIYLDVDNDDHMPPSGKPQLSLLEIKLLEQWINKGSDFTSLWKDGSKNDSLVLLANQVFALYDRPRSKTYDFDFVSNGEIESLNSPFRTVSQIATDMPALKASYYLAQYFNPRDLKPLESIKLQLVDLNLAGMPVTDRDIDFITQFENLESLNLNNTDITDQGVNRIANLSRLQKLSLAGTNISTKGLNSLAEIKSLKDVYIWNTKITSADIEKIKRLNKDITWNIGYQSEEGEILKLTPPILINQLFLLKPGEVISLKHNLSGTTIRISVDGSRPDSVSSTIYAGPITIRDHTHLKTMATKEGWFKSNVLDYNFYVTGITPLKTELLSNANKNYKANGSESLSDNQLGDADNFKDGNWLGFREDDMVCQFTFEKGEEPKKLTLVFNQSIGSYLMPPETVRVWGGDGKSSLKHLATLKPEQPKEYTPVKTESISYSFENQFEVIKITATPVKKLPSWHSGKGEKGWLMVSEIIFN